MASNARFPRFPQPFAIQTGPYVGINDTPALSAQDGIRAAAMQNCYVPVPQGDVYMRPGFSRVDSVTGTLTGTVAVTAASANIVGTGTLFLTELQIGDLITVNGVDRWVSTVTNNLAATAEAVWGITVSGQTATYRRAGILGPWYALTNFTTQAGSDKRWILANVNTRAASFAGSYGFTVTGGLKGRLIEYDPSATIPFIDKTSASMNAVALATSQRQYWLTFADYAILTDGVNQAWKISPAYVLTALTGFTGVTIGRQTNYYGKLFFIKASDGVTIIWSEENDPDTGYEAGGFNNAWTLRQTSPDRLEAIEGTNVALYVFRQTSITAITGAVNTDFASAGTQDSISTTVGTRSPDAVVTVGDSVFFLDSQCRPHVIDPGRGIVPLYPRITQTLGTNPPTSAAQLRKAWGRCVTGNTGNPLVVWSYPATEAATTQVAYLVFDAYTRECLGQWTLPSAVDTLYGGMWKDANGYPRLTLAPNSTDLGIYTQKAESSATVYYDQTNAGANVAVDCSVTTPKLAGDTQIEKLFTRLDMTSGDVGGNEATLTVAYQGAPSSGFSAEKAMDHVNVATGFPSKFSRMTDLRGRWAQYRFRNDTSVAARAAFGELQIEGVAFQDTPKMA